MKWPCGAGCPNRTPGGCHCEKLEAWKFCQAQEKEARRRENIVYSYQRDAIRQNQKTTVRRRHRI